MIDYIKLLEEYGLWPVEDWDHFPFVHEPPSEGDEKRQIDLLRSKVAKAKGVYAYSKNGQWIYVGKGVSLLSRLKSHYRESFEAVPGDTKDNKWHRYFSSNAGCLTIYWRQVEDEVDRRVLELAVIKALKLGLDGFPQSDREIQVP